MKNALVLSVAALGCIGLGLGGMYLYSLTTATPESAYTATQNPVESITPEQVQVKLPGADPIDAMSEDFTKPSSLWVVVSKQHPLTDPQYYPTDLLKLTTVPVRNDKSDEELSLRPSAARHLSDMLADAKKAGHELMVGSAFRSYALQNTYYSNYVRTSGEAAANLYSAKPGESEHQTGLSVDLSLTSRDCYLETCFGQTEAGKWLAQHAPTYGFIVRYPLDKTAITQYQYEPWHFRYVGAPLATALMRSGLTLDEAYPHLEAAKNELITKRRIIVE